MIGSEKTLKPEFKINKESDFILDFFPGIKNEDWKYTNLKKFVPKSISVQPFSAFNNNELIKKIKSSNNKKFPTEHLVRKYKYS